jgi:hypothetical protein
MDKTISRIRHPEFGILDEGKYDSDMSDNSLDIRSPPFKSSDAVKVSI